MWKTNCPQNQNLDWMKKIKHARLECSEFLRTIGMQKQHVAEVRGAQNTSIHARCAVRLAAGDDKSPSGSWECRSSSELPQPATKMDKQSPVSLRLDVDCGVAPQVRETREHNVQEVLSRCCG